VDQASGDLGAAPSGRVGVHAAQRVRVAFPADWGRDVLGGRVVSPDVLRKEGRWAGESSFQSCIRDVGGYAEVSATLGGMPRFQQCCGLQGGVEKQPGQGTNWGQA